MKKILLAALFALVSFSAQAATTPNSVVTAQTPSRGIVQFLQGTDTAGTYKTLYTAGTSGSIIKGIVVTTNDPSAAHLVTCQLVNSAVKYGGVAMTIPVSSGFANGVPQVNLMAPSTWVGLPVDSDGNPFLFMNSGDTLQCTYATTITTSDLINIIAVASDF